MEATVEVSSQDEPFVFRVRRDYLVELGPERFFAHQVILGVWNSTGSIQREKGGEVT